MTHNARDLEGITSLDVITVEAGDGRPIRMEEAAELSDYLPLSFKTPKEQEYIEFLLQNHDTDEREYADAVDQIREVLIHEHYLSQKDMEIFLDFDVEPLADHPEINLPAQGGSSLLDSQDFGNLFQPPDKTKP